MYGLDAIAGCCTRCRRKSAGGAYVYILNNEVPGPERRLLATVGQLLENDGDAYYPRRWAVPQQYSAEVDTALAKLYVTVEAQPS
jgi:GT2 family glycosyltransferase